MLYTTFDINSGFYNPRYTLPDLKAFNSKAVGVNVKSFVKHPPPNE